MSIPRDAAQRAAWLTQSQTAWNARAPHWDQMLNERPSERDEELAHTIDALDAQPGMRLLDAACGSGQWAVGFAQHGCEVVAMDLAPAMVEHARANAQAAGVAIEFRVGDISRLTDPDASFQRVHCRCALQLSPDPAGVLREFARVLAPGGRLFAAVPGALSRIYAESYKRFLEPTPNNRMLPWELEGLLGELGWTVLDGWPQFGPPAVQAIPAAEAAKMPRKVQQATAMYWPLVAERPA
jgi:SAM-dependent methyltransferase